MLNALSNILIKTVISVLFLSLSISVGHASDWNAETHNIILGDYNGDGVDDILLQTKDSLYLNGIIKGEGNGQFLDTYQNWEENYLGINWNSNASAILTGDFNGDSRTDLLIRSLTDGSHRILLADTEGKFNSVSFTLPENHLGLSWSTQSSNIVVADFNNDNYADVFLQAKTPDQSSSIITTDTSGNLTIIQQTIAANHLGIDWSQKSHNIISGDFNGDGYADLFLQAVSTIVMIPMDDLIVPIQVLPKERTCPVVSR